MDVIHVSYVSVWESDNIIRINNKDTVKMRKRSNNAYNAEEIRSEVLTLEWDGSNMLLD